MVLLPPLSVMAVVAPGLVAFCMIPRVERPKPVAVEKVLLDALTGSLLALTVDVLTGPVDLDRVAPLALPRLLVQLRVQGLA